ncbi:hypothetical protein TI01_1445 [Lysobacter sp. A03]|nr:hypothetical protein TI01_1445 [Lysobacter sp. A03]
MAAYDHPSDPTSALADLISHRHPPAPWSKTAVRVPIRQSKRREAGPIPVLQTSGSARNSS